jgi:hypothetical protein
MIMSLQKQTRTSVAIISQQEYVTQDKEDEEVLEGI